MRTWIIYRLMLIIGLLSIVFTAGTPQASAHGGDGNARGTSGLFFVDYRNLKGGKDGIALIDLNPESKQFGKILQNTELGAGVLPHHLYWNSNETRLYTTALGGSMLYELILEQRKDGAPRIKRAVPIDTGGNQVGEDIFFSRDGSRFYMTFLGGQGADVDGTVGVFNARTNRLIRTIRALPDGAEPGKPFIAHPHGISANEDLGLLMVTSSVHPDLSSNPGNTVTTIDLRTGKLIATQLVAASPKIPTQPVEVLLTRGDLAPVALATTLSGDIWAAPYDEEARRFGAFTRQVDGAKEQLGAALEFYIHTDRRGNKELYVSFGAPGVVKVYGLDKLPALTYKRTLSAGAGAHHMAFFETPSGREVVVVQNNLLNLPNLSAGTLQVLDIHTGEVLKTLNLARDAGLMPEAIESATGHGAEVHH